MVPQIRDGLAIYDAGQGNPLLLMPYPHGYSDGSMLDGEVGAALLEIGRRVISFDPPGANQSTRPPDMSMQEMLSCAAEALETCGIENPLPVVGHSMGGMCSLGLALEQPNRLSKLVLIGSLSGGPAVRRNQGMPFGMGWLNPDTWRYMWMGIRQMLGSNSMALHKRMSRLMEKYSFVDARYIEPIEITPEDRRQPGPVRDSWPRTALRIDYLPRLGEISVPTLVMAGRHDPQAPLACSQELATGIPHAELVIFEHSGHYPHIEERAAFLEALQAFLAR